jgi:hypothetical protein
VRFARVGASRALGSEENVLLYWGQIQVLRGVVRDTSSATGVVVPTDGDPRPSPFSASYAVWILGRPCSGSSRAPSRAWGFSSITSFLPPATPLCFFFSPALPTPALRLLLLFMRVVCVCVWCRVVRTLPSRTHATLAGWAVRAVARPYRVWDVVRGSHVCCATSDTRSRCSRCCRSRGRYRYLSSISMPRPSG